MKKAHEHKFHSFLAPYIQQYLNLRQSLGYRWSGAYYSLRELDYFIFSRGISNFNQLDDRFAINWMFAISSYSNATKNIRLCLVRGFFRYLMRLGLLKENPALRVEYLKVPSFKPYIYSLKEIQALIRQAETWQKDPKRGFLGWLMPTLIYLLYACGLRLSEALNLKLADIDFNENTLSIWKSKFHKERLVPFSQELSDRLKQYLFVRAQCHPFYWHPEAYLFCNLKNKRCNFETIHPCFRELRAACGFSKEKGPRLHDLRHSFAVHRLYQWYQEEKDILNKLPLLSTYMGHGCISSTQVYLKITKELLREGNLRFRELSEPIPRDFLKKSLKENAAPSLKEFNDTTRFARVLLR